jgi:5-oxopent-3-ene-1,2,5-tricarboxylate decarboxylase/2-hydroxyhepta-2,4-diene-1,7-dioate isomerase
VVAARHIAQADDLAISVSLNAHDAFTASTASSVRGVAQLIADVTDFMTLSAGDVITLGVPHGAPVAHIGDTATLTIAGMPPLIVTFVEANEKDGEPA